MSVGALTLTAYVAAISGIIEDDDLQRKASIATPVVIDYQQAQIPFSYKQWQLVNSSVCSHLDTNAKEYSECTIKAKSLFSQICTALTNTNTNLKYWHHQKYRTMYCDAAVSYTPKVATISYGENTQMTTIEKNCNQLILQVMVSPTREGIKARDKACAQVK